MINYYYYLLQFAFYHYYFFIIIIIIRYYYSIYIYICIHVKKREDTVCITLADENLDDAKIRMNKVYYSLV